MRFLFTTLQFQESEFYARVGAQLEALGHDVEHVMFSRRSARALGARCLAGELAAVDGATDWEAEGRRIAATYEIPTLRDVYKTDWPVDATDEPAAVQRTVRHFLALERIFDELRPDVVVPEVGSETMRTATHLIAMRRGIGVLFLFYTLFPRPLRLYRDTMHAPIVSPEDLRDLTPDERDHVESFIADFTARDRPIRDYREARVNATTLRDFARHLVVSARDDRDNEYLRPQRFVSNYVRERLRGAAARRLYRPRRTGRPFVYFPLHVVNDYKILRIIPHTYDQASLIEQVAGALPHGYDIVLKEHPMSIGRNRLALLHRLARIPNARLVEPRTSSHELVREADAVVVISSTVGLEALLHGRPVLTLGQPFYSGYGVTLDVDSFREIREAVPAVLAFAPDRERTLRFLAAAMRACWPGKPVLVDRSEANARELAASLDAAARGDSPPPLVPARAATISG
ncbi:MAG: hypothetical protein ACR2H2_08955 [Solirubrobacteraceae bacterium]